MVWLIIDAVAWVGRRIGNAFRSTPQITGSAAASEQQTWLMSGGGNCSVKTKPRRYEEKPSASNYAKEDVGSRSADVRRRPS